MGFNSGLKGLKSDKNKGRFTLLVCVTFPFRHRSIFVPSE